MCGRFCSDEGVVAGYDNRIRAKYTAKWGVQIAGTIFQTRSNLPDIFLHIFQYKRLVTVRFPPEFPVLPQCLPCHRPPDQYQ
ncbi:DUF6783 domain-containing protein [Blautia sp. MSJ-9]|uniref:DUF6783 domain-containing protein n=1 Tax=Blautia sp. MSJ-9 TaxID=2841511 RepID=UPI002FE6EE3F